MMPPLLKAMLLSFLLTASSFSLSQSPTYYVDVVYPESKSHIKQLKLSGTVEAKQRARLAPLETGLIAN